jgi:hypothetical protein
MHSAHTRARHLHAPTNLDLMSALQDTVPGSSEKKVAEGGIFYEAKGCIFFRLFCLTNPAQLPFPPFHTSGIK